MLPSMWSTSPAGAGDRPRPEQADRQLREVRRAWDFRFGLLPLTVLRDAAYNTRCCRHPVCLGRHPLRAVDPTTAMPTRAAKYAHSAPGREKRVMAVELFSRQRPQGIE